jgi:hypothetical protein
MDRDLLLQAALFALVSIEAVAGYALAEALRLRFLRRWSRTPPLWRLAWLVGLGVWAINAAALLLDRLADVPIASPTADVQGVSAILLYPPMAMAVWSLIVVARRELMRAHGRDPYAG